MFIVIYILHFIFRYKTLPEIKTRLNLAAAQVTRTLSLKVFCLLCVKMEDMHCVVHGHSFSLPFAAVKDEKRKSRYL
jgi:hypothetical protein